MEEEMQGKSSKLVKYERTFSRASSPSDLGTQAVGQRVQPQASSLLFRRLVLGTCPKQRLPFGTFCPPQCESLRCRERFQIVYHDWSMNRGPDFHVLRPRRTEYAFFDLRARFPSILFHVTILSSKSSDRKLPKVVQFCCTSFLGFVYRCEANQPFTPLGLPPNSCRLDLSISIPIGRLSSDYLRLEICSTILFFQL